MFHIHGIIQIEKIKTQTLAVCTPYFENARVQVIIPRRYDDCYAVGGGVNTCDYVISVFVQSLTCHNVQNSVSSLLYKRLVWCFERRYFPKAKSRKKENPKTCSQNVLRFCFPTIRREQSTRAYCSPFVLQRYRTVLHKTPTA